MASLRRPKQLARAIAVFALLALSATTMAQACSPSSGGPAPPPCVQGLSTSCQPLYSPPTFDTLYAKLFVPTCASGTGTCHTPDAAKGGLVFSSPDDAYSRLVAQGRVIPNDPSCSLIMKRLTSTDPNFHMPPGPTSISAGEQCTIVQWIAAGAKR
jgi:Planctomycete cytochrome C